MIRRLEDRLEKGKQFVFMIQESMLATEDRKTELYFMKIHGRKLLITHLGVHLPLAIEVEEA